MSQIPPITATARLAHDLRTDIEAGRFRHGKLLPPTKELARIYSCSASTVSRACNLLSDEGLLEILPSTGRVVLYRPEAEEPPSIKPVVLLIGGYAGTGKTELGRILARATHWAMFDKDTTTRPVVEVALTTLGLSPHDRDSHEYQTTVRPAEYDALLASLEENIECGSSCIVTAPFVAEFADTAWCERTRAMVTARGGVAHFIWVFCDPDTMHRYLRKRGAARDTTKLADWPAWLASLDLDFRPAVDHVIVDNSAEAAPLHEQAEYLLATVTQ